MASRFLGDAASALQEAWLKILNDYNSHNPGKALIITCTYRSEDEQKTLYAQGRTKPGAIITYADGDSKKSNHNYYPSRAMDFAVMIGGKITWDYKEYNVVGELAVKHGMVWGGDWERFKDRPHIGLPKDD